MLTDQSLRLIESTLHSCQQQITDTKAHAVIIDLAFCRTLIQQELEARQKLEEQDDLRAIDYEEQSEEKVRC